jgi:hypothetical protein
MKISLKLTIVFFVRAVHIKLFAKNNILLSSYYKYG